LLWPLFIRLFSKVASKLSSSGFPFHDFYGRRAMSGIFNAPSPPLTLLATWRVKKGKVIAESYATNRRVSEQVVWVLCERVMQVQRAV